MICEQMLLDRSRRDDRDAFGQLVRRYRNRLLAAMTQFTGCSEAAEDVVQETFVQAFLKLNCFRGHSSFYTWLYRIGRNRAISLHRKTRPTRTLETEQLRLEPMSAADCSPSHWLEFDEKISQVRQAVDRLPEMHRTVLLMREWQELDYEAIADKLGVNVGTVKSRLHRARNSLRDDLLHESTPNN